MPINDTYTSLPGFVAQINDKGLTVPAPQQTLSQSVLLLGVATDGPANTPIQLASIADAERIFGVTTKSTSISGAPAVQKALTRGVYEAFQGGATTITLVRVGGTAASLALVDGTVAADGITLTAGYPGAKYNGLTASVTIPAGSAAGNITITTLDGVAHAFNFTSSTLYGDLINTINSSNINVQATQGNAGNPLHTVNLSASASTHFAGGDDGVNVTDAQYSDNLTAAYKQLEDYAADIVVPLGAYLQPTMGLDNAGNATLANTNTGDTVFFGQNLAQFVARLSVRTRGAIGVISMAPLPVPTWTNAVRYANQLLGTAFTFQYAGDYSPSSGPKSGPLAGTDGQFVDTGYLLNIVAGPDVVVNNPQIGNYQIDGAATYAGRIASLAPQSATTNKTISSIIGLAYNFGTSVQNGLVANRMVCMHVSQGAVRVVADQTYSLVNRDFTKLSTLRVTNAAVEAVRNATKMFIGEAATPANLNAMGTAIKSALSAMKTAGALIDGSYQINASAQDQIDGNLRVTLTLVPALQIRKIVVTVSLTPAAAIAQSSNI